jgi:hypothetical protein
MWVKPRWLDILGNQLARLRVNRPPPPITVNRQKTHDNRLPFLAGSPAFQRAKCNSHPFSHDRSGHHVKMEKLERIVNICRLHLWRAGAQFAQSEKSGSEIADNLVTPSRFSMKEYLQS